METSFGFEFVSLAVLTLILVSEVVVSARNPKIPSNRRSFISVIIFALLAVVFGVLIYLNFGPNPSVEFFSGWLTEYSLSVDNLFVFVLIMNSFKVPKHLQKEALGVGIIVALIFRGIFILIGSALIERFTWIFYIFGIILIWTAIKTLVDHESEEEYHENLVVKFFHRVLPMSTRYNETKLRIPDKNDPKVMRFTPLLIVFIALGVTDLLFAFDSIPAIFGLTKDPFIVFTANIFALLGLQQLYFLLGNLVEKLVFLPLGLSIILAFIGVKLINEALHGNGINIIPEVPNLVSLAVIIITVLTTSIASILKIRRDERRELLSLKVEDDFENMPEFEKESIDG